MKRFVAKVECKVVKTVICEAENEEEVKFNIWATNVLEEIDVSLNDWEVLNIQEDI
jgi:hypothetical protein